MTGGPGWFGRSPYSHRLHFFAQAGSVGQGLTQADLATRLIMLAATYEQSAEQHRKEKDQNVIDTKKVFEDLKVRLGETFKITDEQHVNIRTLAKDVIYEKGRMSVSFMQNDIWPALLREQGALKFTNIFGIPVREKVLKKAIQKTASGVRSTFREDILASVSPGSAMSLSKFTYEMAMKYKRGGAGENLDRGFTLRNALLRKFVLENLKIAQTPEAADPENEDSDSTTSPPPQKRKHVAQNTKKSGGRIARGQDFWSLVDAFFTKLVKDWGRVLTAPSWKAYMDEVILEDNKRFDDQSNNSNDGTNSKLNKPVLCTHNASFPTS
ncbi:hypothetical protein M413DRAFT_31883 [Hebeloma cylindrosporum]|uniref:Uncharacterized protein n=1 Tax=Hebeloma cylindrosporum TaxID=76867 RepID=A0A0C2XE14_HEBCY|nr:hypothetical protein M413DRAFT_31883 [Hebeloma cylindrosporum h7]